MIIKALRTISYIFIFCLLAFYPEWGMANRYFVKSVAGYAEAEGKALPGDTILWKTGRFADVVWMIGKDSLCILAEIPGETVFEGKSRAEIKTSHVTFRGFQFRDGSTTGDVFTVSGSHNTISDLNIDHYDSHYYFHIRNSGRYNVVENCNFENKPPAPQGKEGTSVLQVAVDSLHPGYNRIRYCSFQNHTAPPNSGGDYGMEALRIGYSFQSKFISRTIVEYCWFYRCNGDGEVISSKARENVYRYNTFSDNGESHLTLRHGSNNVVYGNFFLGGAGVRIKEGQNQMVYNNYFSTGRFWAIRLENYKADPLKNIVIVHNTFYESGSLELGGKGDYQPEGVSVSCNLFLKPAGKIVANTTGREFFSENITGNDGIPEGLAGFQSRAVGFIINDSGFAQPVNGILIKAGRRVQAPLIDIPELDDDPGINFDICGNQRYKKNKSAGCFETVKNPEPLKLYATRENTGPVYFEK